MIDIQCGKTFIRFKRGSTRKLFELFANFMDSSNTLHTKPFFNLQFFLCLNRRKIAQKSANSLIYHTNTQKVSERQIEMRLIKCKFMTQKPT